MTDRLILGLAVPFGQPTVDGRDARRREDFALTVDLQPRVPLRWEHAPILDPTGCTDEVGTVLRWAALRGSSQRPAGLLALSEVQPGPYGSYLLGACARGEITGLSLRVVVDEHDGASVVWPTELSLCHRPKYAACRVIGTGVIAALRWELLTGQPAPQPTGVRS